MFVVVGMFKLRYRVGVSIVFKDSLRKISFIFRNPSRESSYVWSVADTTF